MRPKHDSGTNDEQQRPVRQRPRRSWIVALIVAVAVVTTGIAGLVLAESAPGGGDTTTSATTVDGSLPWPEEGQATAAIVGGGSLGTVGEQTPVPIASVTKVMTAYVILTEHPLRPGESGPPITVDQQAQQEAGNVEESTVPVRAGHQLSERQLLELMLIPSGNNIARLLARWDAGNEQAFVAKMNRAADKLGMTNTTYTGASGLEDSTTSTAADQLELARRVMRGDVFRDIVDTQRTTVDGIAGSVSNSNKLLDEPGVVGIKTGSTTAAGGALMWAVEVATDNRRKLVLGVVLQQNSGGTPMAGLLAALESSEELIDGIRDSLGSTSAGPDGPGRTEERCSDNPECTAIIPGG